MNLASFTTKFKNGFFVDVNVCSGQHNCWVDAILYDPTGKEVVVAEPYDVLLGSTCFEYGGDKYFVDLVA